MAEPTTVSTPKAKVVPAIPKRTLADDVAEWGLQHNEAPRITKIDTFDPRDHGLLNPTNGANGVTSRADK